MFNFISVGRCFWTQQRSACHTLRTNERQYNILERHINNLENIQMNSLFLPMFQNHTLGSGSNHNIFLNYKVVVVGIDHRRHKHVNTWLLFHSSSNKCWFSALMNRTEHPHSLSLLGRLQSRTLTRTQSEPEPIWIKDQCWSRSQGRTLYSLHFIISFVVVLFCRSAAVGLVMRLQNRPGVTWLWQVGLGLDRE